MPPRKRARAAAAVASNENAAAIVAVAGGDDASWREAMGQLWRDQKLIDCVVTVGARSFHAHRLVLCALSAFMRAAFLGELAESETASVSLSEVTAAAFEAALTVPSTGCTSASARSMRLCCQSCCSWRCGCRCRCNFRGREPRHGTNRSEQCLWRLAPW